MSYRNSIVERSNHPYPMSDGFELLAVDEMLARLDDESAAILRRNQEASVKHP
jgi:hypothetical protein